MNSDWPFVFIALILMCPFWLPILLVGIEKIVTAWRRKSDD